LVWVLNGVPFHSGSELVVWEPRVSMVEVLASEIVEICEEVEIEDSIEVFGPQIELDLGQGSSIHDVEPPVEVAGVVPTVVVEEEEESSVEVLTFVRKTMVDQAERTGAEPVPGVAELKWEGQAMGIGESVHEEDRSGEEPDLMEVDQAVRTGDATVREVMEEE